MKERSLDATVLMALLRPSPAILLVMVIVIAWAGYLVVAAPDDLRAPYIVMLLCQSFAASTGYATRARRGHFDQLLAGRRSRLHFALAHASTSIAYGAAAWFVISGLEALAAGGRWPLGIAPTALVAFAYISAIAWGLSVPSSRYAIGVVWLIVTVGLAASGRLVALRNSYATSVETWAGVLKSTGAALVFPPFIVAEPTFASPMLIGIMVLAGAAALAIGVMFISSYCLSLEDVE